MAWKHLAAHAKQGRAVMALLFADSCRCFFVHFPIQACMHDLIAPSALPWAALLHVPK